MLSNEHSTHYPPPSPRWLSRARPGYSTTPPAGGSGPTSFGLESSARPAESAAGVVRCRSLIPASWTDLKAAPDKAPAASTDQQARLASLSQLLHTRTIVDALVRRREASEDRAAQSGGEEWKGGATEPARAAAAQQRRGGLEDARRQTKEPDRNDPGTFNHSARHRRT